MSENDETERAGRAEAHVHSAADARSDQTNAHGEAMSGSAAGPATCVVCRGTCEPLHRAPGPSLTSLCEPRDQPVEVWICPRCGHVQTPAMHDVDHFYASDYTILLASQDEDQIVHARDGAPVFRFELQSETLQELVTLAPGAEVLDYGSAKAGTWRRVLGDRPDLAVHVFDVSDLHRRYWSGWLEPQRCATFEVPGLWKGRFELVTSFFVLEHVPDPVGVMRAVHELLADGGAYYVIVPDPAVNVGDLLVADHCNHFTATSLMWAAAEAGFSVELLDTTRHHAATIALLRRRSEPLEPAAVVRTSDVHRVVHDMTAVAGRWHAVDERIGELEREIVSPFAIYGAGFYGSYVYCRLRRPERVLAFVDRNPHLHSTTRFGQPVVAPDQLDPDCTDVIVGLNPAGARANLGVIDAWGDRPIALHHLDGGR